MSKGFSFPSSFPSIPTSIHLSSDIIPTFQIGRLFNDNTARINSLDFRSAGDLLVTASDDESIHLYNIDNGIQKKEILSKRYGADLVRFTHHHNAILVASKNSSNDYAIRYLSLHDNRYLKYFKGHKSSVIALAMSPIDDSFLSGSTDQTVRLWDLRTNVCQGMCKLSSRPTISYDPQGLIFAIAGHDNTIKLYDKRTYDGGPFSTFIVPRDSQIVNNNSNNNNNNNNSNISMNATDSSSNSLNPVIPNIINSSVNEFHEWSSLKFSPDGKYMLISTLNGKLFLLDAFNGNLISVFDGISNKYNIPLESSFSPDSQFVLSGSDDGSVHIYETQTGEERFVLENAHPGPVQAVQWCPDRLCFATAATSLALWVPSLQAIQPKQQQEKS